MMKVTFPIGVTAAKSLATVSMPTENVYLLSMHSPPDNRLAPEYISKTLLPALDFIEQDFQGRHKLGKKEAALVITGERSVGKFFSNGLDLQKSADYPHFFKDYYNKLLGRVLTSKLYTVAAINGHCFAGGLGLAMACDYKIMKSERAWCAMNEVAFGSHLPLGLSVLLSKTVPQRTYRNMLITAQRYTCQEALDAGIIDEIGPKDSEGVIARAIEKALSQAHLSQFNALDLMKKSISIPILEALEADNATVSTRSEKL